MAPPPKQSKDVPRGDRLQKALASAGLGSRRQCEQLIVEGRVEVDRQVVTELGSRVARHQEIRVDGEAISRDRKVYYMINKPTGVVCTNNDPEGRMRVVDLLPDGQRLFTVGRLDKSSEGLILATNDGELANRLAHPRYGVEKTYRVTVIGHPQMSELKKLEKGVHLADGVARVSSVTIKNRRGPNAELEIVLKEGRNREIRRVLARIGHKVLRLRRIALGRLRLGEMPTGAFRLLEQDEVKRLLMHTGKGKPQKRRRVSARRSRGDDKPPVSGENRKRRKREGEPRRGTVLSFDSGGSSGSSGRPADRKRRKKGRA